MKVELEKQTRFFELKADFSLRPRALVNYLQEVAAIHSEQVGFGAQDLINSGNAWVLHRIGVQIHRPPTLGDRLKVVTWHTGQKAFRAYRDFEILCGGEVLVSAKSFWLFIDLARKKIVRPPKHASETYTQEPGIDWDLSIDEWKPDQKAVPEHVCTIATRPSDYDPLGHVNNAVYFDYLETLIASAFPQGGKIQSMVVQFSREIPRGVEAIQAGLWPQDKGYAFRIFSGDSIYSTGEFQLFSNEQ